MAKGTELVPIKVEGVEITDPAELERVVFEGSDVQITDDPIEAQREILRRIFAAETPEELLSISGAVAWQELIGVPINVLEVSLRASTFEEGSKVYAIVRGERLDEGEPVTLSVGGINVLGQLMQAARKGWLPMAFVLARAEKPTASGFYPLWLKSP